MVVVGLVEGDNAETTRQIEVLGRRVLGTGWFGAVAAEVAPGKTVAVVGDGMDERRAVKTLLTL